MTHNIPLNFVRECLNYDPLTGTLTWRTRPRSHFETNKVWLNWNARFAGKLITYKNHNGYLRLSFTFNGIRYKFYAHQIAWYLVHGQWPRYGIDHKNRDKVNNRIGNLREATQAQQLQNQTMHTNNTSGFPGVSYHKARQKWVAWIMVNKHNTYLGIFTTPQAAYETYKTAKAKHHPFYVTNQTKGN